MHRFHFIEDYEKLVAELMRAFPLDEAMSRAVGGDYERTGRIEADALIHFGLKDGMRLADLGCGSGRAAWALGQRLSIEYDGYDIVQAMLNYAKTRAPRNYRFHKVGGVSIPARDESFDFVCAFSVFTHLLHEESYIYMREARRVLKPGGKLVFSFLEMGFRKHWHVFEATVNAYEQSTRPHLNMFIERGQIEAFAEMLGFRIETFVDGDKPMPDGQALGQAISVLVK